MNIPEVVITVCCTVAGSVAIAYTTLHLQAKHRKRTLLRALYGEIELNRRFAVQLPQQIHNFFYGSKASTERPMLLYISAYQDMRSAGELLTLPESIRQKIEYTYELINLVNHQITAMRKDYYETIIDERITGIIRTLKSLEDELPKHISSLEGSNHEPRHEPQEDLLRRYLVAQAPAFLFFGLSSILAYRLLSLRINPDMSIWERSQAVLGWLLIPIGGIAILWAFVLLMVGLKCKMPRRVKRAEEAIIQFVERRHEPFYYVATMTVFGVSFAAIFANMIRVGIRGWHLYILYGVGALFALLLFLHNIRSSRQQKRTKVEATQDSQSQSHDA